MMDCKDADQDHKCDYCNIKLTTCLDDDNNHNCDICSKKLSRCIDKDPVDHVCEYCFETISECSDKDKNHICDECAKLLSTCHDDVKDHLCDVCSKALSKCVDENEDYICEYCHKPTPTTIVTVADGCLVNGAEMAYKYHFNESLTLFFSYEGDDGRVVDCWVIFNSDGNEIGRVEPNAFYELFEYGKYYAEPVFE